MCGAGTFSIEAALLAQDLPPGRLLRPSVVGWPTFPKKGWAQLEEQIQGVATSLEQPIFSSDRDQGAIRAASSNAARAGVAKLLEFRECALNEVWEGLPETGLVVVNPPYGQRIGEKGKIHGLYSHYGKALRERYPGWRIAVVCPDKSLAGRLAPGIQEMARFKNGGLAVGLYLGTLPEKKQD
jgi:putative N6-adenine-specific DNA methylase